MTHQPICSKEVANKIQIILNDQKIKQALDQAKEEQEQRISDQIKLTEVPSPPFHEDARAKVFAQMLAETGIEQVHQDEIGNVIGRLKGTGKGPVLVIGAHLDTVFPEGTNVKVHQEGSKYFAPGISDDDAGLASILQVARCLIKQNIKTVGDIVFVGTLGEEGNGDLRGCKALFAAPNDYDGMLAIDSANVHRLCRGGIGCKRYRVIFEGLGGHSLHKFGIVVSAIHGLARAITKVDDLVPPTTPKCTFNFGVIKGGTSINAIAARAEAELDIRSEDQNTLQTFVDKVLATIKEACEEENKRWAAEGENAVKVRFEQIGDRPAGVNPDDASVIQAGFGSMNALGISLDKYPFAATDQNVPLSYGLPATTLGAGGTEGNNHALGEWWDSTNAWQSPQLIILTALTLVGLAEKTEPVLEIHKK